MRRFVGTLFAFCLFANTASAEEVINLTDEKEWDTIPIEQKEYMPEKLDIVTEDVEFNNPAPYLGLSFTDKNNKNEKWEFRANIGVKYNGDSDIISDKDASYQAYLERKAWELENDSNDLDLNPVVMMGVTYNF